MSNPTATGDTPRGSTSGQLVVDRAFPRGGADAAEAERPASFDLPGLCAEARVQASFGRVPAHLARKGDPVLVSGNRYRQIEAVREYRFDPELLAHRPEIRPVSLRGRCAGPDGAEGVLQVSPGQRVQMDENAYGGGQCLVPARALGRVSADPRAAAETLTYFRFIFAEPVLLWVEGLWLECPRPDEG